MSQGFPICNADLSLNFLNNITTAAKDLFQNETITVRYRYIAVNFYWRSHERRSLSRPWGRCMGYRYRYSQQIIYYFTSYMILRSLKQREIDEKVQSIDRRVIIFCDASIDCGIKMSSKNILWRHLGECPQRISKSVGHLRSPTIAKLISARYLSS